MSETQQICRAKRVSNGNKIRIHTEDGAEFCEDENFLIRQSNYFKSLFRNASNKEDILIRGVPGETGKILEIILRYIHGKKVTIDSGNVVDLLKASDLFMLKEFPRQIESVLLDVISKGNCIPLYTTSLNANHVDIFKISELFVQIHFESIVSNVRELPFKHIEKLLSDNKLNTRCEDIVFDAIFKWVLVDKDARYDSVPMLMRCIRFDTCDESFFKKMIDHPMIKKHHFFSSIVAQCKRKSTKPAKFKSLVIDSIKDLSPEPLCLGPRNTKHMKCHIAYNHKCICERGSTIWLKSAEDYSEEVYSTFKPDFIPKFVLNCDHRVLLYDVDGKYFAIDILKNSSVALPPPPKEFDYISFSLVNGRIYALLIDIKPWSTNIFAAEYKPRSNQWHLSTTSNLHNCKVRIDGFETAAVKDCIYVVARGCLDDNHCTAYTKIFDTKNESWSSFSLPGLPGTWWKLDFSMVAFYQALFFICGRSVFRFRPSIQAWEKFQELLYQFDKPRAVIHNDTFIIYENLGIRLPIYWNEALRMWQKCSSQSILTCEIGDGDVLWKYKKQFLKHGGLSPLLSENEEI